MTEPDAIRDHLRGDLLAAMRRLSDSGDDLDERRRALSDVMGHLYSRREFECRDYGARHGSNRLRDLGDLTPHHGDLIEALILWRHVAIHHPEQLVELRAYGLYPGEDIYPSEWLYTGENLCIVRYDEAPRRVTGDKPRRDYFREHIAGKPLLPLLARASAALDQIAEA